MTFLRDGEAALNDRKHGQIFVGGILQERADRRQARVTAPHAVLPLALEVIEEGEDQSRVQVGEDEVGRRFADRLLRER